MDTNQLPLGIRKTAPRKDGTISYEARINRLGITTSKRFHTTKEAIAWKTRIDALIESGIDPREMEKKATLTRMVNVEAKTPTLAVSTVGDEIRDVAPTAQVGMTVEQAINGYLAHRSTSHQTLKPNQITEYERVRDDLGSLKIANLVNKDIANYISLLLTTPRKRDDPTLATEPTTPAPTKVNLSAKARANARYKAKVKAERPQRESKPLAEATVRKYILAMKTAIKWQAKNYGVEYHRFLFDFDHKTMPAAWNGRRDRRLSAGEEEKLYACGIDRGDYTYTEKDWRMLLGFALETALRQQELALAKWEDERNNWSKLFIPKKNSKTKKDRFILLSPRAREIIEYQKATCPKGEKRIFHQFPNANAICTAYMALTSRAGIENLTFHDLRHEATSRLCESGKMSLMEIMEMTGHDTMATFKGYVKLIAHENTRRLQ
jgi:integrase